jgi:transmembrane sensor
MNESSFAEKQQIEEFLERNREAREYLMYLKRVWSYSAGKRKNWDVESAWKRLAHDAGIEKSHLLSDKKSVTGYETEHRRSYRYRGSRIGGVPVLAVALLIIVLIPFLVMWQSGLFNRMGEEEVAQREVVTKKGQYSRMTLSDGTTVLVSPESTIQFPERFTTDIREMSLEGEAYFSVVNNPERTFRVRAGGAVIDVLGTSFNVNTQTSRIGSVDVIVSDGTVSLKGEHELVDRAVTIRRGMMSSWNREVGASPPVEVDLTTSLAWIRGELIFEGTPMREVIVQLERRYNIIIQVEDESILARRLTATFGSESIDEIIKNIALSINVAYRKDNDNFFYLK